MKTKHTPGPWYVQSVYRDGKLIDCWIDNDPREHGDFKIVTKDIRGQTDDELRANALRIVDCVNACEGIADVSVIPLLIKALDHFDLAQKNGVIPDFLNISSILARAKGEA